MKSCKGCSRKFKPSSNNNVFHSSLCKNKYYRTHKLYRRTVKINREFFKKPLEILNIKKRVCLSCDRIFLSEGKFNRICKNCKKLPEYNRNLFNGKFA